MTPFVRTCEQAQPVWFQSIFQRSGIRMLLPGAGTHTASEALGFPLNKMEARPEPCGEHPRPMERPWMDCFILSRWHSLGLGWEWPFLLPSTLSVGSEAENKARCVNAMGRGVLELVLRSELET